MSAECPLLGYQESAKNETAGRAGVSGFLGTVPVLRSEDGAVFACQGRGQVGVQGSGLGVQDLASILIRFCRGKPPRAIGCVLVRTRFWCETGPRGGDAGAGDHRGLQRRCPFRASRFGLPAGSLAGRFRRQQPASTRPSAPPEWIRSGPFGRSEGRGVRGQGRGVRDWGGGGLCRARFHLRCPLIPGP